MITPHSVSLLGRLKQSMEDEQIHICESILSSLARDWFSRLTFDESQDYFDKVPTGWINIHTPGEGFSFLTRVGKLGAAKHSNGAFSIVSLSSRTIDNLKESSTHVHLLSLEDLPYFSPLELAIKTENLALFRTSLKELCESLPYSFIIPNENGWVPYDMTKFNHRPVQCAGRVQVMFDDGTTHVGRDYSFKWTLAPEDLEAEVRTGVRLRRIVAFKFNES